MQRNFCKHQESQKVLEKPISASAMENEQPIDLQWMKRELGGVPEWPSRMKPFRRSLGSRRRARAVEDEAGVGRRAAPRRLQVEEVRRLAEAGGGGVARSGSGIVARGRAEALSGEEEVAEAAGAREVGCDAGVVLDGGGGRRRRAPPRLGDGRDGGTGERSSGCAAARLSGALVRGWG